MQKFVLAIIIFVATFGKVVDAQEPEEVQSVFIIACDVEPKKIIILDNTGKWLNDVKSVNVIFAGGVPPIVTCTIYRGFVRPTRPEIKTWKLAQFKSVNTEDFQSMIDGLQTDPNAVTKILDK